MKERIGFIGLGIMGEPMATNLINSGYPLSVFDIRAEPVENLAILGATRCTSIPQVGAAVGVIITMLPDSPDVESVYLGEQGIISAVKKGTVLIDMSTIAPAVAIKVAEVAAVKGCPMLDAPVSGGDVGALKGTLSIMVGGDANVFELMQPIFRVMGTATHCGENGAGQIVKACNQILVAVTLIGMSEALVLGAKAGVDPAVIVKVLSGGLARCGVLENRGMRVVNRDFEPGFKAKLHYKDLNIIQDTGRVYGTALPASSLAHELFCSMVAHGRGELDHSGIMTVLEDLAGIQVRRLDRS